MSNFNSTLTAEQLKERLYYDPETGLFTWKKPAMGVVMASPVGYINGNGYMSVMLGQVNYRMHRLAWLFVHGEWPAGLIDHINGIKTDNRICNLRVVNKSGNGQNLKGPTKGNKSGFLGVTKHGKNGWRASIQVSGVSVKIGTFRSPELAYEAYISAKRVIHPMGTL
jgi:hypothetical protein